MMRPVSYLLLLLPLLVLPCAVVRADEEATEIDLARVGGVDHFPGDEDAKDRLSHEGFVVLPRYHRQMFTVYQDEALPYYITCDSAHWTWQVLFGAALLEVEQSLARELHTFAVRLHERLRDFPPSPPILRDEGYPLAQAYAAVTARLLGEEADVPVALEARVAAEVRLVTEAEGLRPSPLFGGMEDYAVYLPRGFYGDDPRTHPYFRARLWMGRRAFRVQDRRETAAALVLVRAITTDEALTALLARGTQLFDWLVGPPDDLTIDAYAQVVKEVVGASPTDEAVGTHLVQIERALAELPPPEINAAMLDPAEWMAYREQTKGLRLLPLRRTPDAWLFQGLAEADPERRVPSGLEVALALGSTRAGVHLEALGTQGRGAVDAVLERRDGFFERFGKTHYGDTLRLAAPLYDAQSPLLGAGAPGEGAARTPLLPSPRFRSASWRDRLLTAGLGTWVALRHAWILHQKPAMLATGVFEYPPGVVEPAPRFFRALGALATSFVKRATGAGLLGGSARETVRDLLPALVRTMRVEPLTVGEKILLDEHRGTLWSLHFERGGTGDLEASLPGIVERLRAWLEGTAELEASEARFVESLDLSRTKGHLEGFARLMERLAQIADRELAGQSLPPEDLELIRGYGKRIAALNFVYDDPPAARKQMGLVVDIGSNPLKGARLLAALGAAMEIYVVLDHREGEPLLYRGGVYSYYEFTAPSPMTDAAWRRQVTERRTPAFPMWVRSYVAPVDVEAVLAGIRGGKVMRVAEYLYDERIGVALRERLEANLRFASRVDPSAPWRLRQVGRYAAGSHRNEVIDLLLAWLLRAEDWNTAYAAQRTLARLLTPEDRPLLTGLLRALPADAVPAAHGRLVDVLSGGAEKPSFQEIDGWLADASPAVRLAGVQVLSVLFERKRIGPGAEVAGRLVRQLAAEKDAGLQEAALEGLAAVSEHVAREHASEIATALGSDQPAVRAAAAHLLGRMRAADQARRLLDLLADADEPPEVTEAAARAVARALRGPDRDEALADRAVDALVASYRRGTWAVTAASLDALGVLGGAKATGVLGGLAAFGELHIRYRCMAIEALGRAGEAALPYLFPLCFDETPTGARELDHDLRVCDEAAVALEAALGESARESWERYGSTADMEKRLDRMRAEARKRGYGS